MIDFLNKYKKKIIIMKIKCNKNVNFKLFIEIVYNIEVEVNTPTINKTKGI